MSDSLKILIADDHVVLREGLRSLLNSFDGWEVVGQASTGLEALSLIEQENPQLLLIDINMPTLGGIETVRRLRKDNQNTKVLILSSKDDQKTVREAMRAGANGFVPKTSESDELEFAITSIMKGQTYLSPSVCDALMVNGVGDEEEDNSPLSVLTDREREVMKLLTEGKPNRDVAKTLHISARTVDSHRANIMKKLGVSSNADLVQIALKNGLIE